MPGYNGDRKDVLIRQILEAIAEENRKDIIERLLKGRQERIRKGLFPGGNTPYGYVRINKTVAINMEEAEIIREIFSIANQYDTGQKIADELNRRGCTRRNGRSWTQRQVCRILHREKLYLEGFLQYGRYPAGMKPLLFLI